MLSLLAPPPNSFYNKEKSDVTWEEERWKVSKTKQKEGWDLWNTESKNPEMEVLIWPHTPRHQDMHCECWETQHRAEAGRKQVPRADLVGPKRLAAERQPMQSDWEGFTLDGKHALCKGPGGLQSQGTQKGQYVAQT